MRAVTFRFWMIMDPPWSGCKYPHIDDMVAAIGLPEEQIRLFLPGGR
jgi:hypothetical protein